jgi:hypothetical protein
MYRFQASETFWKKFYRLSSERKEKTIYSVVIEADSRAIIYLDGNTVWTVDIGTHAVYR